jgi:hypothetical protein
MPVLQELLVLGALRVLALLGGDTALEKAAHPRTCILLHSKECASSLALVDGPRVSQHREHCDAAREQSVRGLAVVGKNLAPECARPCLSSNIPGRAQVHLHRGDAIRGRQGRDAIGGNGFAFSCIGQRAQMVFE